LCASLTNSPQCAGPVVEIQSESKRPTDQANLIIASLLHALAAQGHRDQHVGAPPEIANEGRKLRNKGFPDADVTAVLDAEQG
jgi:hypothetical protein